MARNLYRSYLYVILLLLLSLVIYALAGLLDPLWRLTPLRPGYEAVPDRAEVVQALVFAVTVLLFVAVLGGLHYWLLRRDLRQDPAAGSGAVRAFFLNLSELVLAPIAIFSLGQVLTQFQSGYAATGLAVLAGLLVLEWERRRLPVGSGLARFFQRLHVYGVQLILLFPLVSATNYFLSLALDSYLLGGGHVAPSAVVNGHADLRGPLATALWFGLAWFVYGYLNRHDPGSWLRRLFYGGVLAYGLFLILDEWAALLDLLLRFLTGEKIQATALLSPPGALFFTLPSGMVLVGLLVAGFAWLWLQSEVKQVSDPLRARALLRYSLLAMTAALLALLFWLGAGVCCWPPFHAVSNRSPAAAWRLDRWGGAAAGWPGHAAAESALDAALSRGARACSATVPGLHSGCAGRWSAGDHRRRGGPSFLPGDSGAWLPCRELAAADAGECGRVAGRANRAGLLSLAGAAQRSAREPGFLSTSASAARQVWSRARGDAIVDDRCDRC